MSTSLVERARIPHGTRIYAVGDVHGRADLLNALMERVDTHLETFPISQPMEVFLGAYIDRGPQSREVLSLLIERRRRNAVVCLKGNHETLASRSLDDPSALSEWSGVGALETLRSYGVWTNFRGSARQQKK